MTGEDGLREAVAALADSWGTESLQWATERRERLAEMIRSALRSQCNELVRREYGQDDSCGRPAIALRRNTRSAGGHGACPSGTRPGEYYDGRPYPVCLHHARPPLVMLDLIYAAIDMKSGESDDR